MPNDGGELLFQPEDFVWRDPEGNDWSVSIKWALVDGRPEPIGIELWLGVRPDRSDARGVSFLRLSGRRLRAITSQNFRIRVGEVVRSAREDVLARAERSLAFIEETEREAALESTPEDPIKPLPEGFADWVRSYAVPFAESLPKRARPRKGAASASRPRQRLDAEFLEQVAAVYRRSHAGSGRPTRAVADHFDVPYSTANKWVAKARDHGALGPTEPGQPGETKRPAARSRGKGKQ